MKSIKRQVKNVVVSGLTVVSMSMILGSSPSWAAGVAPDCIKLRVWDETDQCTGKKTYFAEMKNRCGVKKKVKMNWRNARDGNCVTFSHRWEESRQKSRRFLNRTPSVRKLENCKE